jgi:phospholipid/cholesterol/gamma-HCH transport system substrate-binding protein
MPRFREVPVLKSAIVGVGLIVGTLVLLSIYPTLPIVQGHTYKAVFSDAGGLKTKDQVRVAGVPVGEVTDMELVGNTVEVTFTAKKINMADNSTAAIKTGTLLGKRFLGVEPGSGPAIKDDLIPISRTSTPYNVSRSLEDVGTQLHDFDKDKIEQALNTFADAFQDTPENFRETFINVKALSQTISTRDQALRELLAHANAVAGVLSDRTDDFTKIVTDGNDLLAELKDRQELLRGFFKEFDYAGQQARLFIRENDDQLGPVLKDTNNVLHILEHNNDNLQLTISRVGAFITGLGEGVGNGPGFEAGVALTTPGAVFNYTDLFRQFQNPQKPRVPETPGLPGGGALPNPLYAPPSGNGSLGPQPPPADARGVPSLNPWGTRGGN